jgi:hypothetical protein
MKQIFELRNEFHLYLRKGIVLHTFTNHDFNIHLEIYIFYNMNTCTDLQKGGGNIPRCTEKVQHVMYH